MTQASHGRVQFLTLAVLLAALAGCAAPPPRPAPPLPPPARSAANPAPVVTAVPVPVPVAAEPAPPSTAAVAASAEPEATAGPSASSAVDPMNPDVRIDLGDRAAQADLWNRLREGFAMPDLDTERVRDRERWYASRPDYVQRMTERGSRYLFHIVEELDKRGMPSELALLPFIESAFNPQAMSSAKASGMWQFMPATGRDFALRQNVFRDDRRSVLASTRAALDYLQRLHADFGDWHLALAAYNCGEGNVQRAIARNQRAGLPTDYASLQLPAETQFYVPKLQAVKNIVARPGDFGLTLPPLANHPYFVAVRIERDIDVALAAKLSGMSLADFRDLNPQMNKPVILAAGTPHVLLPYDNAGRFIEQLPQHRGALASWTAWVAPRTLRPTEAARLVGMQEATLRELNRIPPRMLVKAGSTLLVPRSEQRVADVTPQLADNATISLAPDLPPMRRVTLRAGKRGETVAGLAKRYRTTPAQVAAWNHVAVSAHFKAGQQLVVFVPQRAAHGRGRAVAAAPRHGNARHAAVARKSGAPTAHRSARMARR